MYTVKSFEKKMINRGLFATDMQEAHTAIIVFENGDWMGVSRYHDEDYWVADCAFRENGYPVFSNGEGTRLGYSRCLPEDQTAALDALL